MRRFAATWLLAGLAWLAPEFDLPAAGTPFDLQGYIDREVKAGNRRIVVPPGQYRVAPKDRQHLRLEGMNDLQILADGVEMICTETTRAITIRQCTNVTVRGLTIDYDPLPFTQGRITSISADRQTYEVELFEGYPEAGTVRNFKYEIFRPDTRTLRCEDRAISNIEVLDPRHLRLASPGRHETHPEQVGDLIVIGSEYAPHGSAAHAVECSRNANVRLEDITLFASNCFGFLEYDCDGSVYARCRIDRRPTETDPVKRGSPRLRSLDADAFHSKHALKGPSYLECTARFMGDDCINICGDYHMIMGSTGKELRVLAKGAMNIQPGDPVELVLYTGERLPDAQAVSVQPTGSILEEERAFLSRQNMDAGLKSGRGLSKAFSITLNREVNIPRGGIICSANRIGNGFAVKDCNFGFNRSRGILIKASRGEITGNRMEGCWMSAILVSPEYWWLEAGSSSDLKITHNTIRQCGGVPIRIEATGGSGDIAPAGAHRNITVTDNTITGCAMPGILVTSTAGLQIGPNTFENWNDSRQIPGEMRRAGLTELKPVVEINCRADSFTYENPLEFSYPYFDGNRERNITELRDPAIIREGDLYYLVFTHFPFTHSTSLDPNKIDYNSPTGIRLYSSPDLKHWKFERWLIKSSDLPEDCPYKHRFWAPEIHKIKGKFYLIFTGDNWIKDEYNKGGKIGAYVAFVGVADKVTGPYEHVTWLKGAGCDSTLFGDDDGKVYAIMPFGNEYIQEADLGGIEKGDIKLVGERKMIVPRDNSDVGKKTSPDYMEGPWMIKRNGKYILFTASPYRKGQDAGKADAAPPDLALGYWVGAAVADNIWGPYKKEPQVFLGGHIAVFQGPDGNAWFSYRGESGGKAQGRLCIDPIQFNADGSVAIFKPSTGVVTIR